MNVNTVIKHKDANTELVLNLNRVEVESKIKIGFIYLEYKIECIIRNNIYHVSHNHKLRTAARSK